MSDPPVPYVPEDYDATGQEEPLVLVVPGYRSVEAGMKVSLRWADTWDQPLVLLYPLLLSTRGPPEDPGEEDAVARAKSQLDALLEEAHEAADEAALGVPIEAHLSAGKDLPRVPATAAEDTGAETVLLPGLFPTGPEEVASAAEVEEILDEVPCRSVAYREPPAPRGIDGVVAAVGGGPNSFDVVWTAEILARSHGAELYLVHVAGPDEQPQLEDLLPTWGKYPPGADHEVRVLEGDDVVDRIVDEADAHDALVIGAPVRSRLRRLLFGSEARAAARRTLGWSFTVQAPEEP